jgi:hypothetical protein
MSQTESRVAFEIENTEEMENVKVIPERNLQRREIRRDGSEYTCQREAYPITRLKPTATGGLHTTG